MHSPIIGLGQVVKEHPNMSTMLYRAPRYGLSAKIELTDLKSERQIAAQTQNISVYGCAAKTAERFPERCQVRLRISHSGANVVAVGKVVYSRPNLVMGIAFLEIDPSSQKTLEDWIVNLSKSSRPTYLRK